MAQNSPLPEADLDALLGGRLRLWQATGGHRAGSDAVLLAACAPPAAAGRALDFGAGTGAVGLAALLRAPALRMSLLEIDPVAAALARANVAENGLSGRADVVEADGLVPKARRAAGLADGTFDLVLTNPPFHAAGSVRVTPDVARARAHVAGEGGLDAWMRAALALLAPGGLFLMVHRADALAEILAAAKGRIGGLRLLPVHAQADARAIRLLVAGRKGSRAPLAILPGLALHGPDGRFTPQAEAVHRGEAGLDLGLH